jgi:hypothetical protein
LATRIRDAAAIVLLLLVMGLARPSEQRQAQAIQPTATKFATPGLIHSALTRGEISQDLAYLYLAYALGDYQSLPVRFRSDLPWDGTLPLRDLTEGVRTMRSSALRSSIESLLSGSCGSSTANLPSTMTSPHFLVEYGTVSGGLVIQDYINSLETAWGTEVDQFGWAAPPLVTSDRKHYHVRIDDLGGGLYGYVSTSGTYAGFFGDNPNTSWNEGDAYATCMVLNQDYSGFPSSPDKSLDATTAHEFNHSIQFGYGALGSDYPVDDVFAEGGATWMEDEVFDNANDNYNYLWPTFSSCMGAYPGSPYPYWITFRGMTERFGSGVSGGGEQIMQDFWELTSKRQSSNLAALNTALNNKSASLANAYHAYAIAVKFNKPCGGGYVYPYCLEESNAYLASAGPTPLASSISAVGGSYTGGIQDNYALNWIGLPTTGGSFDVTLENTSSGGQLHASVVCDTGATLVVNGFSSLIGPGDFSTLTGINPSGCNSLVAVLTNQSQTADNPSFCSSSSYELSTSAATPIPKPPPDSSFYLPLIGK